MADETVYGTGESTKVKKGQYGWSKVVGIEFRSK